MLIVALLIIAKIWKQPKCPSVDEWMELRDIHTMEYYLAIKKKERKFYPVQQHGWTWRTLC